MKKILYLLLITILINYKDALNNPFRPGVDNPYEVEKKPLTDAELAEKLQNEEYEKAADTEKLENRIKALNKLLKKYKKNYDSYIKSNEAIKVFKRSENIKTINMENELILTTSCLTAKNNSEKNIIQRSIERKIAEYQENLYKLNRNQKEIVFTACCVLLCHKKLDNALPSTSIATKLNPGAQAAYDAISQHELIKNGELKKEAQLVLYFFTKEYAGELEARVKEIINL